MFARPQIQAQMAHSQMKERMKTTPESILRRIARLRDEHTRNFNLERWQANDTVSRKIREAWAQYHAIRQSK